MFLQLVFERLGQSLYSTTTVLTVSFNAETRKTESIIYEPTTGLVDFKIIHWRTRHEVEVLPVDLEGSRK
jgi:hypothetical protein